MKPLLSGRSRLYWSLLRPVLYGVLAILLPDAPAYAQDKTSEIDEIFSWTRADAPGCAVAVSQHGQLVVNRAYGLADLEREVPITPTTVFDAGSVQKQFVAAAVLLLVEEGRLSLSEDVRTYIPELPDTGHKITLDHLLTHTSGIRDWTGILPLAEGDPKVLTLILRQRSLDFAPGEEWSYSNSGYVLLKEIVARTSGVSFSDFTQPRLFEPLGMNSTAYVSDMAEVVKNRALAYAKEGDHWKQDMLLGNKRGGGALFSTASDLLIWNEALTNGRFGPFVTEKLQEPATLNNGRRLGYGRGLFLDSNRGGKVVWHSGGAAGYSSLLSRYPEQGLSIAIMCNADGTARTAYARRIFDVFVPAEVGESAAERGAPAEGADVAEADLNSKAGLFFSERTGQPMRLIARDGRLEITRGPGLLAVTSEQFRNPRSTLRFMSGDEFEIHFLSEDEFELKSSEGATARYRRARPYTPSPAEMDAYAGRYESDEMGSVLEIVPEKDGLVMRFYRTSDKALQLKPVDRDTFMLGMMTVRFVRDATGKIVGYDYSNPVVRNIRFTRLSDNSSNC